MIARRSEKGYVTQMQNNVIKEKLTMLQLNTIVTFSLRVPLGLGYTVLDTIRLPNVRLEMVGLKKKTTTTAK